MTEPQLLPIFLKLAGRTVLMVGAGPVAASKLSTLVPTGARLIVVAPSMCDEIRRSPAELRERPFRESDLDGVWLVVAAATPEVNRLVGELAGQRQIFVNAVDDPANASAYLGGTLRRSSATIAISTQGRAPALAGLLREGIDALLPENLDAWFDTADELKQQWRSRDVPMAARRPQLAEALVKLYGRRDDERGRTTEEPASPEPGTATVETAGGPMRVARR